MVAASSVLCSILTLGVLFCTTSMVDKFTLKYLAGVDKASVKNISFYDSCISPGFLKKTFPNLQYVEIRVNCKACCDRLGGIFLMGCAECPYPTVIEKKKKKEGKAERIITRFIKKSPVSEILGWTLFGVSRKLGVCNASWACVRTPRGATKFIFVFQRLF